VIRQAPATLHQHDRHDGHLLRELLADLQAMHGCLTTGPLLLAPARDDLHALMSSTVWGSKTRCSVLTCAPRVPTDHR
jgi:hypothetical protein